MDNNELAEKIKQQDAKLEAIYKSVEKLRKYFLVIIWIAIITFVLPLLASAFIIPYFLKTYLGSFEGVL